MANNWFLELQQMQAMLNAQAQHGPTWPIMVMNPAATNPAATNPGVMNPGVMNPGVMNPGVMNPGVMNPGVMNPGILHRGINSPSPMKEKANEIAAELKKSIASSVEEAMDSLKKCSEEACHNITQNVVSLCNTATGEIEREKSLMLVKVQEEVDVSLKSQVGEASQKLAEIASGLENGLNEIGNKAGAKMKESYDGLFFKAESSLKDIVKGIDKLNQEADLVVKKVTESTNQAESKLQESCSCLLFKAERSLKDSVGSFDLQLEHATGLAIDKGVNMIKKEAELSVVKVESKIKESCDGLLLKAEGSLKGSVESFHLDLKQATEMAIENGIDKLYQETDLCIKKVNESRNQLHLGSSTSRLSKSVLSAPSTSTEQYSAPSFGISDFGDSQDSSKLTKEMDKSKLRYQPRLGSSTSSFLKFGPSEPSTSSAQYHLDFADMEESSEPTKEPEQTKLMHSVLLHGSDSESESDVDPYKYNGKENSLLDVKKLINKNLQKDSVEFEDKGKKPIRRRIINSDDEEPDDEDGNLTKARLKRMKKDDLIDYFTKKKCAVCLGPFLEPKTQECGHTFCEICICEWHKVRVCCPVCRNEPDLIMQE